MAALYNISPAMEQPYDKVPITAKTWEEIDIAWNNSCNKSKPNTAKLLRPIQYAKTHGLVRGGHVQMNLTEFGVPHAHIIVTKVKPLTKAMLNGIVHLRPGAKPVIGLYIHQTNDVRTYHFRDNNGDITTLHATPNHPFYVKNLKTYMPITNITSNMILQGKNHHNIYLICKDRKHYHCGTPYRKGKITTVYNIEVYQQHVYRIGRSQILAHNPCEKPFVSLPIEYKTSVRTAYRWDTRPPEQILNSGFAGSKGPWFNKIFGNHTVFAARNMEGAEQFAIEVWEGDSGLSKTDYYTNKFLYLYEIDSTNLPTVDLGEQINKLGLDKFAEQLATRNPGLTNETFYSQDAESLWLQMAQRSRAYLGKNVQKTNEIQILGPIPASRINFIKQIDLNDPS